MHKNPFIPTLGIALLFPLWAAAQGPAAGPAAAAPPAQAQPKPAEVPAEPPTEAEKLIDAAVKKLAGLSSASADLVQKVEMLGQKFQIDGRFLKAPQHRVFLRLVVRGLTDASGMTQQVCDGKTLWDYQQVLEQAIYRKLDIVKVFEKLDAPEIEARQREQIMVQLGFSGPETLLIGLRQAIKFDQKEEGTLDGKPVWIVRGTWTDRNGLLGPTQQPLPKEAPLPPYVPSVVSLWIGKEDGWPYKLVLLGKVPTVLEDTRPIGPDGQRIGNKVTGQKVQASRVEVVYMNVKLNPALKLDEFLFQAPPGAQVEDGTEGVVSMLERAIRSGASKQKSSESGEKLLEEKLNVPAAPASSAAPPAATK